MQDLDAVGTPVIELIAKRANGDWVRMDVLVGPQIIFFAHIATQHLVVDPVTHVIGFNRRIEMDYGLACPLGVGQRLELQSAVAIGGRKGRDFRTGGLIAVLNRRVIPIGMCQAERQPDQPHPNGEKGKLDQSMD